MQSLNLTSVKGLKTDSASRNDPGPPIRIAIVDDDENDRRSMRHALGKSVEFVCVGEYGSANEALAEFPKLLPHVVLMDIRMPDMSGIECTRRLKCIVPRLIVIMVSGLHHDDAFAQAMEAGADDYLAKPVSASQFLATLTFCLRRQNFRVAERQHHHKGVSGALTARESKLMELMAEGFLYKEIAAKTGMSKSAVHQMQHRAYRKLGAMNRTEAIRNYREGRTSSQGAS